MAIPFAWVETEGQAQELIILHCAYNSVRKVYQVRREWELDDIATAVAVCRKRFGFPPKEINL